MKKVNWRKSEDYIYTNKMTASQWAWEFLKRNSKYIEIWDRLSNHLSDEQKMLKNWHYLLAEKGAFRAELCDATIWGLKHGYLNPYIEQNNIEFIPLGGERHVELVADKPGGLVVLGMPDFDTGSVLFQFNFNEPIAPQMEIAKRELIKLQSESKMQGHRTRKAFKPRRDEWVILIRILDAMAAMVKDKEIAEVLFPNKCPVLNKIVTECPLNEATGIIDDECKCPLSEGSLNRKCPVEDPINGIKKVYDKKEQASRYVNQDYRSIPYSEE